MVSYRGKLVSGRVVLRTIEWSRHLVEREGDMNWGLMRIVKQGTYQWSLHRHTCMVCKLMVHVYETSSSFNLDNSH